MMEIVQVREGLLGFDDPYTSPLEMVNKIAEKMVLYSE